MCTCAFRVHVILSFYEYKGRWNLRILKKLFKFIALKKNWRFPIQWYKPVYNLDILHFFQSWVGMQNHGFCTYEVGCAGHFTVYIEIKLLILHLNNVKSVPYVCLIQSTSDRKIYTIYMTSHIIHGLSNTMRKEQERVENWHLIMRISCSRRFMSYCCLRVIELTFHRECVTHKWREYYWSRIYSI
jgi:hypothetical protein